MVENTDTVPSTSRLTFGAKVQEAEPQDAAEDVVDAAETSESVSEAEIEENPDIAFEAPEETSDEDQKSVEQLAAERERLDAEIRAKQDAQKAAVIEQIKSVMQTYSVPLEDLVDAMGGLKSRRKGVKAKQKYRDPDSGKTWSGRGKEPAWIRGKDREDFLIPEEEQT